MTVSHYILWDFDGTLAYRDGMWTDALLAVSLKNNITHIRKEDVRPFLNIGFTWHSPDTAHEELFSGKGWWEYHEGYFQEVYEKLGIESGVAKRMSGEVRDEYIDSKKWHVYSDTIEALEKLLANNYRNVIVSNHVPELPGIVSNLGLGRYFDKIFSSASIGYEKPNRKFFDFVIADLNVDRTNCIMIGDSYDADVAGALRSTIKPILVRKENTKRYKWFCDSLDAIQETIELVFGEQ